MPKTEVSPENSYEIDLQSDIVDSNSEIKSKRKQIINTKTVSNGKKSSRRPSRIKSQSQPINCPVNISIPPCDVLDQNSLLIVSSRPVEKDLKLALISKYTKQRKMFVEEMVNSLDTESEQVREVMDTLKLKRVSSSRSPSPNKNTACRSNKHPANCAICSNQVNVSNYSATSSKKRSKMKQNENPYKTAELMLRHKQQCCKLGNLKYNSGRRKQLKPALKQAPCPSQKSVSLQVECVSALETNPDVSASSLPLSPINAMPLPPPKRPPHSCNPTKPSSSPCNSTELSSSRCDPAMPSSSSWDPVNPTPPSDIASSYSTKLLEFLHSTPRTRLTVLDPAEHCRLIDTSVDCSNNLPNCKVRILDG